MPHRKCWYIFCLPLRTGPGSRRPFSGVNDDFIGGDGMVTFVLLFGISVTIPLVLQIVNQIDSTALVEKIIDVYYSTYFAVASLTFIWCTCNGRRSIQREALETLHPLGCHHINRILVLLKIGLVTSCGLLSIIHFIFDLIACKKDSNIVCMVKPLSLILLEATQTVFLLVMLVSALYYKEEINLWKGPKMSGAFVILLFSNIGIISSIFFREVYGIEENNKNSIQPFLETLAVEHSLFSITLLVEFLPRTDQPIVEGNPNYNTLDLEYPSLLTRYDTDKNESRSLLMEREEGKLPQRSSCFQLCSFIFMLSVSITHAVVSFLYYLYSKLDIPNEILLVVVISAHCLYIIWLAYGYTFLASFVDNKTKNRIEPGEFILIGSAVVFFVYLLFEIIPAVHEFSKISTVNQLLIAIGDFVSTFLCCIGVFYQTTFIINVKRAEENAEMVNNHNCTLWLICIMLAVGNLSMWFGNCAWETFNHTDIYTKFYNNAWFTIKHTLFKVAIFYRFHSFLLLLELVHGNRRIFAFKRK